LGRINSLSVWGKHKTLKLTERLVFSKMGYPRKERLQSRVLNSTGLMGGLESPPASRGVLCLGLPISVPTRQQNIICF